MRLAGQAGDSPTRDDAGVTVTLGDSQDVDVVVDGEDRSNGHGALEQGAGEVDLSGDVATVDLDLDEVSLLLAQLEELDLGVREHADNVRVLLEASELSVDVLVGLIGHAASIAVERFLLGTVPVLVESALHGLVQMRGPHGGQGAQAARGVDIADQADHVHGRALEDGDGLDGLALVQLRAGLVALTQDVGHASLCADESTQR